MLNIILHSVYLLLLIGQRHLRIEHSHLGCAPSDSVVRTYHGLISLVQRISVLNPCIGIRRLLLILGSGLSFTDRRKQLIFVLCSGSNSDCQHSNGQ